MVPLMLIIHNFLFGIPLSLSPLFTRGVFFCVYKIPFDQFIEIDERQKCSFLVERIQVGKVLSVMVSLFPNWELSKQF